MYNGLSFGFSPPPAAPLVIGEFDITPAATFGAGLTRGQTVTVPARFSARISFLTPGLDLRLQGSGSTSLSVIANGPGVVGLGIVTGVFSGSVEQIPEQAQVPEPAAWQLAAAGLLLALWRPTRPTYKPWV